MPMMVQLKVTLFTCFQKELPRYHCSIELKYQSSTYSWRKNKLLLLSVLLLIRLYFLGFLVYVPLSSTFLSNLCRQNSQLQLHVQMVFEDSNMVASWILLNYEIVSFNEQVYILEGKLLVDDVVVVVVELVAQILKAFAQ